MHHLRKHYYESRTDSILDGTTLFIANIEVKAQQLH